MNGWFQRLMAMAGVAGVLLALAAPAHAEKRVAQCPATLARGTDMASRDIIVIGASAGGIEAVATIARELPADLPAAVFVVIRTNLCPDVESILTVPSIPLLSPDKVKGEAALL